MDKIAWHEYCVLRDDVRQGTLTLAEFAADLYAVRTGEAPNVYRLPDPFFSRTYPTYNLKTLVRDVFQRLSGRGGKPVIRVQVAYGGGKTHALIALLHLAERGLELKAHPTVQEFMGFSGVDPLPQARVALLPFDKFDVKEGLSVFGPDGRQQQVNTPWGALAYQLAGDEGLAKVAAYETSVPAEPLLVELLKTPQMEGLSTLILIDETLLYMRNAVNDDPRQLGILQDFFQLLTQAVGKVDRAAIVASLISFDIASDDPTGVQVLNAIEGVFHRVEETVEPVSREDISELLRRRLFEPVEADGRWRAIVERLNKTMQTLPLRELHRETNAYNRLLESYPFHPDLLEVFYQKWTQLSKFQRTRGVLRMFATALKASDGKDAAAFVGPSALLGTDDELSSAIRELIEACEEGNQWTSILDGELRKARDIQNRLPRLKYREIEGAVLSTFLHSQPAGQKADLTDLYPLLVNPDIDKMSVEEGLSEWRKVSWFLKEDKNIWALGTTPNLTNMHDRAMRQLSAERINDDLIKRIRDARLGQNADDLAIHLLPNSPADIPDNPELHFVVVGPEDPAVPGEDVSASLKAFFDRTYRNNVIILAPENSRLTGLRYQIRKILGWQSIENGDEINLLTGTQQLLLIQRKQDDENGIWDSVKSTYSVLITVDEAGEIKARLLPPGIESPFERVKTFMTEEDRLLTTSLDPNLLAPDSFFELWRDDETSKPVQRLYEMFASVPRLPRLLGRKVFDETLRRAVEGGFIMLRTVRPDGSQHTYWRESLSTEDLTKKDLEIVPIEHAELHNLSPDLLRPKRLPELWEGDNTFITVGAVQEFFGGDDVPQLASDGILFDAIKDAVEVGFLMAHHPNRTYLKETIPDTELNGALELFPPLAPISGVELSQATLPDAWEEGASSVGKVMEALVTSKGMPIPWKLVVDAVNEGLSNNLFEITKGSPTWPCSADSADKIGLQVSQAPVTIELTDFIEVMKQPLGESGQPTLEWIKERFESKKGSIPDDVFRNAVQKAVDHKIITLIDSSTGDFYQIRVKQPSWIGHAESHLTEIGIQDLSGIIGALFEIAPELDFKFRISITAEGDPPSAEVLEQINETLRKVTDQLKFD